jgi:hypothetical protein
VSRSPRLVLIFGTVVLIALAARTTVSFARFSKVEREFGFIQDGESRASVIARLGKPNYHAAKCGVIHVPLKSCAVEYVYSHPFAPFLPDYYIVSFSADDHVVEADRWTSP